MDVGVRGGMLSGCGYLRRDVERVRVFEEGC